LDSIAVDRFCEVTAPLLHDWPLPLPHPDGDKEERGRILVIGGSHEMPGAVILAAIAAMRAGAGKLTVATEASVAALVAQAIPEARVIGLRETQQGGLIPTEAARLPTQFDAVLIGPGMQDESAATAFAAAVLERFASTPVVLDATAMGIVRPLQHGSTTRRSFRDRPERRSDETTAVDTRAFSSPVLLTPHAGEMAHLTGSTKDSIQADPASVAREWAARWRAVIALKGPTTFIATPEGELWRHSGGNAGLAISGSGDTLAGIIAGLVARGASLPQASVWGVALHALAGAALEERIGPLGYLARELSGEVPRLLQAIATGQV
jgi:ADP-dependent NAD(P)H-hydrate dehydratase